MLMKSLVQAGLVQQEDLPKDGQAAPRTRCVVWCVLISLFCMLPVLGHVLYVLTLFVSTPCEDTTTCACTVCLCGVMQVHTPRRQRNHRHQATWQRFVPLINLSMFNAWCFVCPNPLSFDRSVELTLRGAILTGFRLFVHLGLEVAHSSHESVTYHIGTQSP